MIFNQDQIQEILEVIDYQHILFIGENVGSDVLTSSDIFILKKYGITDIESLLKSPMVDEAYKFGILSQALGKAKTKEITNYQDFKEFVRTGKHLPLSPREKETLKYLKQKTYSHIKNLGNRVKSDTTNIIFKEDNSLRVKTEKIIGDKLKEGVEQRKSTVQIVSDISHETGDWSRDWNRIVETEMHNAFEAGRAAWIEREKGINAKVYKETFPGICRHCIKAYLTGGIGSPPKLFTLSELMANGTNIGKKVKDWLPTLGAMHPFVDASLWRLPTTQFGIRIDKCMLRIKLSLFAR